MAGPWEDYSSGPWEDFEPEQKKKSGKEISKEVMGQVRESMPDYLGSLRGVAEAGRSIVGGGLAGVAGQIAGTLAGLMEHGYGSEEKAKKVEQAAASGMSAFSKPFEPTTEKGKAYTEKGGELINEVALPLAGHMPLLEGVLTAAGIGGKARQAAKQGEREARAAQRTAAQRAAAEAELPPLSLEEAMKQADVLPENQRALAPTRSTMPWEDYTPAELPAARKNLRQGELDLQGQEAPITVSPQGTAMVSPEQVAGYEQFGRRMETPEAPAPRPLEGQGDLFMREEVTGPIATPYSGVARGALEEPAANPRLAARQMELQLADEGTLFGDEAGTITKELPERATTIIEDAETVAFAQREAEAKARELRAKEAVERGETGDLFGDHMNKSRDFELFRDEDGKPLSRKEFEQTIDNLAKEPGTIYVKPEDMNEAYRKYTENFGGAQAGLFDRPTQAAGMADVLKNDAVSRMTDNHPLVKAAERHLSTEQQFLDQLKQQGATAEAIADAARDVAAATERVEKTRVNVTNALKGGKAARALKKGPPKETLMYEGLGEMIKRTAMAARGKNPGDEILNAALNKKFGVDALKNKKVEISAGENKQKYLPPAIKEGLPEYTKERRSNDAIINDIQKNNIPDMPATPIMDKFQAGGHYKSVETNNPVVRKTFAAVSDADHRATSNIKTFIQDKKQGIPALFRRMTKQEAADINMFAQLQEGQRRFSAEELRQEGFNQKQIDFYLRQAEALDFVLPKINEARAAVGKAPINPRMGYLAGQMSGDFRRAIYKTNADGTMEYVGAIGANTRMGLNRRMKKMQEINPEWTIGEEVQVKKGRRESRQKAFEDALGLMADANPDTKLLIDAYDAMLKDDAYNYMNAKKHTMQKKGTFGVEGAKLDVDAWTNAKEGTASQIRYMEKILKWAEMTKAVDEVRPLLTSQAETMPNAVRWSSDYIDRALGIQTGQIGRALDGVVEAVGNSVGVGPSVFDGAVGFAKGATSKYLLGFGNPLFLAINILQPVASLPAINSLLAGRGIRAGMHHLPEAMMSYVKMQTNVGKMNAFEAAIKREGMERNLFGSEIFDHTTHLRNSRYRLNQLAELGIPEVEGFTRGLVFTHFANVLKRDGRYKGLELFDIAENLTNQTMTDYRQIEAPAIYREMGAVGEMMVTLQRYKHNSLSNMAMLGREAKRNGNFKPIATAIASGVAFSGLTGMIGFNEADAMYQTITKAMGKPDTLTRLAMEKLPDIANFGVISTLSGIDMSKRFGMALFPDSPSGMLFPGASRLAEAGGSVVDYAMNPNETNFDRMVRGVAPNSVRGMLDIANFQDKSGMAFNPRTLEATVERTPMDVTAKALSGTGLHESKEKARLYQESLVDKAMDERRKSTIDRIEEDLFQLRGDAEGVAKYFESERGQEMVDRFLEAEGSAKALVGAVKRFQKGLKLTAEDRKLLGASSNPQRAKRYMELKND